MNDTSQSASLPPATVSPSGRSTRLWIWAIAAMALCGAFFVPILELARLSFSTDLYSHVLLIPLVSGYFVWLDRAKFVATARPAVGIAVGSGLAGAAMLAVFLSTAREPVEDSLFWAISSLLLFLVAASAGILGAANLRTYRFSLLFLVFMIPMTKAMELGIETLLQHGSAAMAFPMFRLVGTPILRDDLIFHLPGISLEVAPECSGIRSSLALFITSIVAGQLYLRSNWKRAILSGFVIPLALLRNGFRIFTIGELCVHIGPDMIHSFIHHRGGPIFFALSLIPFGALLLYLMRREKRSPSLPDAPSS